MVSKQTPEPADAAGFHDRGNRYSRVGSFEAAIADCREKVSGLKLDVQRFSADALLSSEARATRDSLESLKGELSLLESKLAVVLKHTGLQQAPGK